MVALIQIFISCWKILDVLSLVVCAGDGDTGSARVASKNGPTGIRRVDTDRTGLLEHF